MHRLGGIPPEVQSKLRPMNGHVYPTFELHQSYHHYLKIVTPSKPNMLLYIRSISIHNEPIMDVTRSRRSIFIRRCFCCPFTTIQRHTPSLTMATSRHVT
mmetsp:Transcript_23546/g.23796  ORF Transcript_23546/g.23796 Transcript_23546/m.23796 type:complete len:100 (+) Transcript_23546:78-377(+)